MYVPPSWLRPSALALILISSASGLFAQKQAKVYKQWLDEEVRWIIRDGERATFTSLTTDQQRDQFVEAFWSRRDPTPGTPVNEFKQEHYRRLAYANEHFSEDGPGWKSDRGRTYIVHGAPDRIDASGSATQLEAPANAFSNPGVPYQIWHYVDSQGMRRDVSIKFVDECRCGKYKIAWPKKLE